MIWLWPHVRWPTSVRFEQACLATQAANLKKAASWRRFESDTGTEGTDLSRPCISSSLARRPSAGPSSGD